MIKIDEFTNEELSTLSKLVDKQIDLKRDIKSNTKFDRMMNKMRKDIDYLELLAVKINNHLGKFK
jgi:hypothetical protein